MNLSQFLPALKIPIDGFFMADLCGFILALPISLFLAFWLSAVKNRLTVLIGAFAGALLGFLAVLGLADTLTFDQPPPNATRARTFSGPVLLCSVLAL